MRVGTRISLAITENLIWVILFFGIIIGTLVVPNFLSLSNFNNILYHSASLGMLVLAISTCLISNNIDLSIESTLAFAPTIAVLMMQRWFIGFNPYAALLITLLLGASVGLINAFFVVRLKINPFLQTLVMLIILRGVCLYLVRASIWGISPVFTWLGSARIGGVFPIASIFLLLSYTVMHFVLTRRPIGRQLYAVGGNKNAAFIAGINTGVVTTVAFVLSGVFAASAGLITVGKLDAVSSAMGEGSIFMAIAGAVLGGASLSGGEGKINGIIAGLLLLGIIDNALNLRGVDPNIIYALKGGILFVAIVLDQLKTNTRAWLTRKEDMYLYGLRKEKDQKLITD